MDAQLPLQAFLTSQLALEFIFVYELTPEARSEAITAVSQMLEDHRLRHNIALTLPLNDVVSGARSGRERKRAWQSGDHTALMVFFFVMQLFYPRDGPRDRIELRS